MRCWSPPAPARKPVGKLPVRSTSERAARRCPPGWSPRSGAATRCPRRSLRRRASGSAKSGSNRRRAAAAAGQIPVHHPKSCRCRFIRRTRRVAGRGGKEECWLVIAAEPDAQLGDRVQRAVTPRRCAQRRSTVRSSSCCTWHPARAGDFFYIPAGTVHAIGPGLSLVEVQQNSDTTFRLYDYGRPRELHLERALRGGRARCLTPLSIGRRLLMGRCWSMARISGSTGSMVRPMLPPARPIRVRCSSCRSSGEVIAC